MCGKIQLLENPELKMTKILNNIQQNITNFLILGARDAIVVVIQESNVWCRTGIVLVARMGVKRGCISRVSRTSALQPTLQILWIVHQKGSALYPSVAYILWKVERIETKTNTSAIYNCDGAICDICILWNVCDVIVYCANFKGVQRPNGTRSSGSCAQLCEQFGEYFVFVSYPIHGQTIFVHNNDDNITFECVDNLCVWFYITAKRLQFISRSFAEFPIGK